MNKEELILFLRKKHPDAEVIGISCNEGYLYMRTIVGNSNLGKTSKGENVTVPIYKTEFIHEDTVKLQMMEKRIPLSFDDFKKTYKKQIDTSPYWIEIAYKAYLIGFN